MPQSNSMTSTPKRLTITLASGQREALDRIAELNGTTRAYVVRYALSRFIEAHQDQQLALEIPHIAPLAGQIQAAVERAR